VGDVAADSKSSGTGMIVADMLKTNFLITFLMNFPLNLTSIFNFVNPKKDNFE
jgi:hypothetical protein